MYWSGGFEQIVQAGEAGKTLASLRAFASFVGFGGVSTRHVPISATTHPERNSDLWFVMGKRKRPKNKALSQEEIWDDSALIRSWEEAVAEYQASPLTTHNTVFS